MRTQIILLASIPLLIDCRGRVSQTPPRPGFSYPVARTSEVVDDYHGTLVADPYRWLEDLDSPETRAWIDAENRVTFGYLEKLSLRPALVQRITELWNYERYSVPYHEGGRYFFTKNDGLQNQAVLYTTTSLDSEPQVLLDPNRLSPDGTVALSGYVVSRAGDLIAYGLASAGSDWTEWRIRQVATGVDLPDTINWTKFTGVSFSHDGKGLFYSRFAEPRPGAAREEANYHNKLYYHRLGSAPSEDQLIYERPDEKEWMFSGEVTDDGRYLVISISRSSEDKYRVYYKDLENPNNPVVPLIDVFEADYTYIDNDGPIFWFKTNLSAPRGRLLEIDITKPARTSWKELIPEAEETATSVSMVNDQFIVSYLKDARALVKIFARQGQFLRELPLPGVGSVGGFYGKRPDKETFYSFTSFFTPATIYRYDLDTGTSSVFRQPKLPFDPNEYETRQVFYPSHDGTRIPLFLSHRKDLVPDGNTPTWLYGYGGFNIAITPSYKVSPLVWMERGGVYAVANLRGGGEYGEAWHQAGIKEHKQNVFDDFIAAAEWLTKPGFTKTSRLAISGASNGGLLVGACVTQRPELFGAAVASVGVLDMLRFHKFTIGWAWTDDYGSSDDGAQFKTLHAYSPLHNLRTGTAYPPMLITTGDHDDRVVPSHSFKFAAALQAAQGGSAPVMIRIETKAGHGAGKPTTKQIEESADQLAFMMASLGLE